MRSGDNLDAAAPVHVFKSNNQRGVVGELACASARQIVAFQVENLHAAIAMQHHLKCRCATTDLEVCGVAAVTLVAIRNPIWDFAPLDHKTVRFHQRE